MNQSFNMTDYPIKEDLDIIKSSPIFWSFIPHRYVLKHIPKEFPKLPYTAYRENLKLVNNVWEPDIKYWCAYKDNQKDAEKEYEIKLASEGDKA
jgi:hypothetical protein